LNMLKFRHSTHKCCPIILVVEFRKLSECQPLNLNFSQRDPKNTLWVQSRHLSIYVKIGLPRLACCRQAGTEKVKLISHMRLVLVFVKYLLDTSSPSLNSLSIIFLNVADLVSSVKKYRYDRLSFRVGASPITKCLHE
jgi:hypothetical protein